MIVFKDFARIGIPVEIGEKADESVPFVKRASLNALFQWKSGLSKIQMFLGVREALFSLICGRSVLRRDFREVEDTHPYISTGTHEVRVG